jgi:hypothetical protein
LHIGGKTFKIPKKEAVSEVMSLMANKFYVPVPIFHTLEEIVLQYKALYGSENPHLVIESWLTYCFAFRKMPPLLLRLKIIKWR